MRITRRCFLSGSVATSLLEVMPQALGSKSAFTIGIADLVIHGQMKPEVAKVVVQAMADVFTIPDRPKPEFQIGSSESLSSLLQKKSIHLAIMTGIEYGWIGQSYPELRPLVTAFVSDIRLKACILAPVDTNYRSMVDLKGHSLVMPKRLQHFPLLYLHHGIQAQKAEPKSYFSRILISDDTEEGIENVVDKKVSAILVDSESWRVFQERKPGRAKRLKMIVESKPFPTAAVVYHPEAWTDESLKLLKNVLCTAHEKPFTRQILNFWRISKFVPYSADYQHVVKNILDEIPKPMTLVPFVEGK